MATPPSFPSDTPFWPAFPSASLVPPPPRAELFILGGGLTGLTLLRTLRAGGVDAHLLERDALGAGASGRNAGFVLRGTAHSYAKAVARYGRPQAQAVWAFTATAHQALLRILAPTAPSTYRCRGSWQVSQSPLETLELQESAELLGEDGYPAIWSPTLPVPASQGGLFHPESAEVDPTSVLHALAAGQAPWTHTLASVAGLETSASGVRLHLTNAAELNAPALILAANGFLPRLLPGLPLIPYRGQLLATTPVPPLALREPAYADFGYRYWRQLHNGVLLIGGWRNLAEPAEMGSDLSLHPRIQDAIAAFALELAGPHRITHRWSGIMAGTPDDLPLVGAVPGKLGLYLCAGYNGHGFGFALPAAELLAHALLGKTTVPTWLRADRF